MKFTLTFSSEDVSGQIYEFPYSPPNMQFLNANGEKQDELIKEAEKTVNKFVDNDDAIVVEFDTQERTARAVPRLPYKTKTAKVLRNR